MKALKQNQTYLRLNPWGIQKNVDDFCESEA